MKSGIVCAGNWVIDKVKLIDRFPEEGTLCNISSQIRSTGGGPANVSFDIAAMDPALPLFAAGRIGKDEDGQFVLDEIKARYTDGESFNLDGFSVEYPDWHFNVRCSNTEPLLRLIVEAQDEKMMIEKRDELLAIIRK